MSIEDRDLDVIINTIDIMQDENQLIDRQPGTYTYRIHIPSPLLVPGNYRLSLFLRPIKGKAFDRLDHACPFEVYDNGSVLAKSGIRWRGKINVPIPWECVDALPPGL